MHEEVQIIKKATKLNYTSPTWHVVLGNGVEKCLTGRDIIGKKMPVTGAHLVPCRQFCKNKTDECSMVKLQNCNEQFFIIRSGWYVKKKNR